MALERQVLQPVLVQVAQQQAQVRVPLPESLVALRAQRPVPLVSAQLRALLQPA